MIDKRTERGIAKQQRVKALQGRRRCVRTRSSIYGVAARHHGSTGSKRGQGEADGELKRAGGGQNIAHGTQAATAEMCEQGGSECEASARINQQRGAALQAEAATAAQEAEQLKSRAAARAESLSALAPRNLEQLNNNDSDISNSNNTNP
jgi:hypothetical protein